MDIENIKLYAAFQSERMMFGLAGKRRCFQWLDAHSRFISTVVLTIRSRRLHLPLRQNVRSRSKSTSARSFTHFTVIPNCSPVIPPAPCSAEAALPSLGASAMKGLDGPDALGVREGRPVDEELWSLKVVMAKTGLSRSTLYAYIAVGAFSMQRRLGKRRIAWFASEVRNWIASRPAGGMGTAL